MKYSLPFALLAVSLFAFTLTAGARSVVLPAGTLLQCTLNEPNLSSKTVDVGDPILCHLRGVTEFGQEAFPRGSQRSGPLLGQGIPEAAIRSHRLAHRRHAARGQGHRNSRL